MQTAPPSRVVVVVDGGAEAWKETEGAVRPLKSSLPGLQIVSTGERSGVSAARNLGARAAESPGLAFLDDDDEWSPEHLQLCCLDSWDLRLSSFLKRRGDQIVPEKTPPALLHRRAFFVTNPGLRGSNLVVRMSVFTGLGGFDESLPSMNDVDFGIRASELAGLRYRRVRERTVTFTQHAGVRITRRGSRTVQRGVSRFWSKWGGSMNPTEAQRFRERCGELFGVEPGEEG